MKTLAEIPGKALRSFGRRIGAQDARGCWPWLGHRQPNGYGAFTIRIERGTHGRMVCWLAHRLSYSIAKGEIPRGLTLDHLCRNRACVNPDHLEAVPIRVNNLRGSGFAAINAVKTHCPNGHPYDERNTSVDDGSRKCRRCKRERARGPISVQVRCWTSGRVIGHAYLEVTA